MYYCCKLAVPLVILLSAGVCMAIDYDKEKARALFKDKCSHCHGIEDYDLSDRTLKEWQLVVERMLSYSTEELYTEEEGDQITMFLAQGHHERLPVVPVVMPEPRVDHPTTAAASQPAVAVATIGAMPAAVAPRPGLATLSPGAPRPPSSPAWRKSRATFVAKVMGYVAAFLTAALVVSGFTRKSLRPAFHNLHVALAIGLFGALAIHASVYLCEYGAPSVLWLWFGIISSVLIALVEFGGMLRRRLGKSFIKLHATCGTIGLILVVLHWVWIYIP